MKRYFGFLLCCLFVVRSALAAERWAIVVGIGNYPQSSGWRAINGDKDLDLVARHRKTDFLTAISQSWQTNRRPRKTLQKQSLLCLPIFEPEILYIFTSRDTGNWLQM